MSGSVVSKSPSRVRRAALLLAGAVTASLALALAGPWVSTASAAQGNTWASYSLAGTARAYTGTMTLPGGFPETTFTSTSRQATVISGSSTWQAASTPVGAIYGSSQGKPYLNQRPMADNPTSPAVTTYTFQSPTPASGWSFVLGDIDADQATITATAADGSAVLVSGLGFQGVYNYCHRSGGPSCDSADVNDLPTWIPATSTLVGNTAASDTEGASGWFSPNVALKTLTITYRERSGLPVYQTWFATKTFAPSGTVTVNGEPTGGVHLTVHDASGAVVGTPTSAADGTWSLPGLVATSGYTVSAETPQGATALAPLTFDTLDADTAGLDFAFTVPTVAVTGAIETAAGDPAAGESVVFTPRAADLPATTVTTDSAGAFSADLFPSEAYTAVVGGATDQPIAFTAPATSGPLAVALVQPAPPVTTTPTPPATPTPTSTVTTAAGSPAPELAFTGSSPAVPLGLGILLALGGAALIVRSRRRSSRR